MKNINSIDDLDKAIKQIILEISKKNKSEKSPVNLNIQFNKDKDDFEMCDDIDHFIAYDDKVYLTMYLPYNLNHLRFDVNYDKNIIMIRSHNFSFYKEVWLGFNIIENTFTSSYKNNILEIEMKIKQL
jgi:hypothetical protein